MATRTQTGVADRSAAVERMAVDWALSEALLGGTRTMRAAGETYLPRWPKEESAAYTTRLSTAVLFPAYQRTIQTLSGKPFSKPIVIGEDVPLRIVEWLKDIDMQGRDINAFAADVMEAALGYGLSGILVEFPPAQGVRTQAQEQAAGFRPYWVHIRQQQILGWRAENVGGVWKLTQLRIMECIEEPDGEFGTVYIDQVRILEPGAWSTYRRGGLDMSGDWTKFEEGVTSLKAIPFVPVHAGRTGFMTAKPPLIEVAHLNVSHWQSASDQQTILHVARVPILAVSGVEDDKWELTVGSATATKLPEGGKLMYVEHSGAAIGAGVTELEKIEERMRQAGAELLVITPRVTATQVQTENAVGMCVLQRIVADFEDALDQALQITADYVREAGGGHLTLFNDFGVATLQEASAQLLLQTNQAGKLSDETLHSEFQRRGILSTDLSWAEEQDRIEAQGPALGAMAPTPAAPSIAAPGVDFPPYRPGLDATELDARLNALRDQILASVVAPTPAMDNAALAEAILAGFRQMPAPQITVEAPTINVTVPEQVPPVVNIAPAAITVESPQITLPTITVNVPEQHPPVVNVAPATVNVSSPPVNVTIEKGGAVKFTEDSDGNITGAVMQ